MDKLKSFLLGIFYIFLYYILSLSIYYLLRNYIGSTNLVLANTSTIFADILVLFIILIIFRKKIIPDFYEFKKNYKKYINDNSKYYVYGLIIMVVSNVIISGIIGTMPDNEEINRIYLLNFPASSIFSMVICAPIIEELITRKYFKDAIKNEYIFILTSGLIFASLHLILSISNESLLELLYIIPYAALGIALSKIYYNTNNIWSNILFHSLHNLIAILLIFIGMVI